MIQLLQVHGSDTTMSNQGIIAGNINKEQLFSQLFLV